MAEQKEHLASPRSYVKVLGVLLLLLAVTILAAFINLDRWTTAHHLGSGWNTAIALTIAAIKGLLILLFFMHLRYSSRLTRIFAAAGFVWLAIMLALTMTDYFSRNHPPGVSPKGEPRFILLGERR